MRRERRTTPTLLSFLLVATLLAALPGTAGAQPSAPNGAGAAGEAPSDGAGDTGAPAPGLPDGWSLTPTPDGLVLTWHDEDVRIGGARPELRLGEEVLGFARERADGLELVLTPEQVDAVRDAPDDLQAWSSGRRLDAPETTAQGRRTPTSIPPTAALDVDPAAPGPYGTERLSYDLDPLTLDGYPEPVEVLAEVTRPIDAPGRRPLVLILHGRHSTCYVGGPDGEAGGGWPCQEGWDPIPSHLGYRYLTDVLASQGYLAVSISANGINGQDWAAPDFGTSARSQLIRHHLDLWAGWAAGGGDPWAGLFRDRVDLRQVVLVGHSRGGEGVNRAAIDALGQRAYRIRGLVSYGPTSFGRQVTPDVHSAVLLPSCDGDVSDLQGQAYVDWSRDLASSSALRSAVLTLGANHNYFNTEWTPGLAEAPAWDDWFDPGDPVCGSDGGSLRLSIEEQQEVGAAYTLALVRLAVRRDAAMLPYLDGSKVKPASIGRAEVSVSPVGGASRILYRPESDAALQPRGMTARRCPGYLPGGGQELDDPGEEAPCSSGGDESPHWLPMYGADTRPAPMALELSWSAPSSRVRLPLGAAGRGVDLRRYRTIDLRVANDPHEQPARLRVRLRDASGRSALLRTDLTAVDGWPGEGSLDRIQARTLRASLTGVRAVDLRRIVAVDLVAANGPGRVWVLDLSAARPRVTAPQSLALPRLSVADVEAPEGGADDVTTVDVAISVEGRVRRAGTVWAQISAGGGFGERASQAFPIALRPGMRGTVATVPITFTGDDIWTQPYPGGNPFDAGFITIATLTGALTTDYQGGVTTVEDEEAPVLSVEESRSTATEGSSLEWTLRLSGPTAGNTYLFHAEAPDAGLAELDSDDVDQDWLEEQLWWLGLPVQLPIDPPVPLSDVGRDLSGHGLPVVAQFDYGETEVTLEVPLRFDHRAEGDEELALRLQQPEWADDPTIPAEGIQLTGSVAAHAADEGLPDWYAGTVPVTGAFGSTPAEEAAIDAIVGDARVILAGEVSRGAAQAVEVRTGLIADRIARGGVTDVRLDLPLPQTVAAARYVAFGEGTAEAAAEALPDELHRTVETVDFLETMRARSAAAEEPVLLLGLDPGTDPAGLVDVVEAHDAALAASIACFDLDVESAGDWHRVPQSERSSCRDALVAARDALAAEAAAAPRDGDGFGAHVAHAASVALLTAEAGAAIDPSAEGYLDAQATLRAEGLADGILAALALTPGSVAAALDDLDAAVLRDVAEPRIGPAATPEADQPIIRVTVPRSTAAVLVDELGADAVASVGVTAGSGSILAYYAAGWDRWLYPQTLDRPARGSVERLLSSFGPNAPAFVVPTAGTSDLGAAGTMRIGVRSDYRTWEADAWYVPVQAADAFDGLVHVRRVRPTTLLSQRPRLELDGASVVVRGVCWSWELEGYRITFDGGSMDARVVYEEEGTTWLDTVLTLDGVVYTGALQLETWDGYAFSGTLQSEGGVPLEVSGFVPWDLPVC
jgi:erythromycin esterase-like protein